MTKLDEYLDSVKRNGHIVYRCKECGFRAFGMPVSAHELMLKHHMVNEDSITHTDAAREFDTLFE